MMFFCVFLVLAGELADIAAYFGRIVGKFGMCKAVICGYFVSLHLSLAWSTRASARLRNLGSGSAGLAASVSDREWWVAPEIM